MYRKKVRLNRFVKRRHRQVSMNSSECRRIEVEGDHREVDDDVVRHAADDDVGRPPTTALRTADDLADIRARSDY